MHLGYIICEYLNELNATIFNFVALFHNSVKSYLCADVNFEKEEEESCCQNKATHSCVKEELVRFVVCFNM